MDLDIVLWSDNEYVVDVNEYDAVIDEISENSIHHFLKCRGRIAETKEHNRGFKQSARANEGCFPLIPLFNPDVIVTPTDVEFCIPVGALQAIDKGTSQGKWVTMFDGDFVKSAIILNWSKLVILFIDKKERRRERRHGNANTARR